MATAIAKIPLSNSTQGKGISITATASAGTNIHLTGTSATVVDEIFIWFYNADTVVRTVTVEFGATGTGNVIVMDIPPKQGKFLEVQGLILLGNGSAGLQTAAFCPTTAVITAFGYVNRITP